jgi:hypothetical protein
VGWIVKENLPSAADKLTGQPIVQATAGYDKAWLSDGWSMVASGRLDPQALPSAVASCESLRQWLVDNGGADVGSSHLRLHLQGTRAQTVTISGLRAHVLSRSEARRTSLVSCPSAGANDVERIAISLDQREPTAHDLGADGKVGNLPYFQTRTVTLSKGEPLDLVIEGSSAKSTVTWQLELDVELGNKKTTIVVPGVFRTSAPQEDQYNESWAWRWDESPQRLEPTVNNSGDSGPEPSIPPATSSSPTTGAVTRLRPTDVLASSTAPNATDAAGHIVSYDAKLVSDDDPATAWRTAGDGGGQFLELTFDHAATVERLGMIPGYAKVDPLDATDRFSQNRRVTRARYVFDDGQAVVQDLAGLPQLQQLALKTPEISRHVRVEILATTSPGDRAFDYTAISEIAVFGR